MQKYELSDVSYSNPVEQTWYPVNPRYSSLSYGYITESSTIVVDNLSVMDKYSIDKIYPNPATEQFKIRFNITESDFYIIKITDMLGNEVIKPINTGRIEAAVHEVEIPLFSLSDGSYFCQVISGTKGLSTCKPFIIQR